MAEGPELTPKAATVADLLSRLSARDERPFLSAGGVTVTAAEFGLRARRLAAGLLAEGLAPGDRLATWLPRGVEEALVLFAGWLAGAVLVPLHPRLKDGQLRHALVDCEPWGLISSETKVKLLREPEATLAAASRRWLVEDGLPEAGGEMPREPPGERAAVLHYTSGSTGPPKAVVQSRRNLLLGAEIVAGYLGLRPSDHLLAVLPYSFDYGLNQLLSAAWTGAAITAVDYLGPVDLGRLLHETGATVLAGVPALWHDFAAALETGGLEPRMCRSLRLVTSSGGRLPLPALGVMRRELPWVRIFSMYGLTEAFRSAFLPPEEIDARPDSFGRAIPGVELLVVEPGSERVLEGPCRGELVHAGALVASGYWNRPADSAARFRPDPRGGGTVVYTGDLVRRDAQGYLYFEGRRDGLLKVAGHRVAPDELAAFAEALPEVGQAAVVGLSASDGGHRLALVATAAEGLRQGAAELGERIRRRCRAQLPPWLVPAEVRIVAALPRTPHGKVDLQALQEVVQAGEDACGGGR